MVVRLGGTVDENRNRVPVRSGLVWIFVDDRHSPKYDSALRDRMASSRADVLALQTNAVADERSLVSLMTINFTRPL